ncbi:hypothetical protein Lalb_Chr11g0070551 [Lupinus albus]|uniref:Uncharacterized protein n=1 Tax=Lupinus albus TaxID=3870 RepID=A0A6A4PS35_LUPAL|nr:hypothetical protein Lalb_Chr11g0070551 [Lupinus albus]
MVSFLGLDFLQTHVDSQSVYYWRVLRYLTGTYCCSYLILCRSPSVCQICCTHHAPRCKQPRSDVVPDAH